MITSNYERLKAELGSFSRADYTCDSGFYLGYVLKKEQMISPWGEMGTFCHSIAEAVGKGEYTEKDGLELFENGFYDSLSVPFPATSNWPDPEGSYYKNIRPWFARDKWWDGEIIDIEKYVEFDLPSGQRMRGYIDQVIDEGGLKLKDFKVAKAFVGKKLKEKKRQLNLYSFAYHQETGIYPDLIEFDYFQRGRFKPETMKFNYDEMMADVEWLDHRMGNILARLRIMEATGAKGLFNPPDSITDKNGNRNYYCKQVCGFRENCPFTDGNHLKIFKTKELQDIQIKK